jgi:hypothetical protein
MNQSNGLSQRSFTRMKKPFYSHAIIVAAMTMALVPLASCNGGPQSPNGALDASNGSPYSGPDLKGPDGQKRVGSYIWIWRTAKVEGYIKSVEVDCPLKYFTTGGGYQAKGALIFGSKPNAAFDGWILQALAQGSGPPSISVIVYAACAPAK